MAEHTRFVMWNLQNLVEDMKPGLIVKALVTSPACSLQATKEILENERVILPQGMGPGKTTEIRLTSCRAYANSLRFTLM